MLLFHIFAFNISGVCLSDHRGSGTVFHSYAPAEEITSTFTPLGTDKEIEFFFASDARWVLEESMVEIKTNKE